MFSAFYMNFTHYDLWYLRSLGFIKYLPNHWSVKIWQCHVFHVHLFFHRFQISNKGNIAMDYNWQIIMDTFASPGPRSVTFAAGNAESRPGTANALAVRPGSATSQIVRPGSAASSLLSDVAYTPFSIEPSSGTILSGKKTTLKVKFSPLDVQEYEARLICR